MNAIKSSITQNPEVVLLLSCFPSLITFLIVCISYRVEPIGGYEQEPEQEVLADPQVASFEETNPSSQQGNPNSYRPCLWVFYL
jgi:hypothetical protein